MEAFVQCEKYSAIRLRLDTLLHPVSLELLFAAATALANCRIKWWIDEFICQLLAAPGLEDYDLRTETG